MENMFELLMEKLDEPHWKGYAAPGQYITWRQLRKLIEELAREQEERIRQDLYDRKEEYPEPKDE